jgi:hypothetical protein
LVCVQADFSQAEALFNPVPDVEVLSRLLKNSIACHSRGGFCSGNPLFPWFFCEKQIPRFARNDNSHYFFSTLLKEEAERSLPPKERNKEAPTPKKRSKEVRNEKVTLSEEVQRCCFCAFISRLKGGGLAGELDRK